MQLSVRNMIAILVTIVILLGVFFVATLYFPTMKQARLTAQRRAMLEAQVEAVAPVGAQIDQEAAIIDAMDMDINFFKKRNLSPSKGIPELLEQINRMSSQMNIRFVAVKPLEEEDAPEYRLYRFLIESKATYPELINFVHRMENGLRVSLNDLRIKADGKDTPMHHLQFTLNLFELKNDAPTGQEESRENLVSPPMAIDLVAVYGDPFSPKKQPEVASLPQKPKAAEGIPRELSRKLVLTGIVDTGGDGLVIINDKILRVGETIHGQRIERIGDDYVIIVEEDTTYPLYLKGSSPLERLEFKE